MIREEQKSTEIGLSKAEFEFLSAGLGQPGGKLPLFDYQGQKVDARIIQSCLDKGLAEHWFANPIKPDWMVCRLTQAGRSAISG